MLRSIEAVDINDGLGKGLWSFFGQIVPDASLESPACMSAREFLGIGTRVRVRCTISVTFKGNGGQGDDRPFGKPLIQIVILRLAFSQVEPPAIIMDGCR